MAAEKNISRLDPRYLDSEDPTCILHAWAGSDEGGYEMDMGGWADADEEEFAQAIDDELRYALTDEEYDEIDFIIVPVVPEPDDTEDSVRETEKERFRATAWKPTTLRGRPAEYSIYQMGDTERDTHWKTFIDTRYNDP